jgi:hypothetical protein
MASSLRDRGSKFYSATPTMGDTIIVPDGMAPQRDWMLVDNRKLPSIAPHQCDNPALNLDAVGRKDPGFMPFVTRLQRDRVASAAKALEGDLRVVDQGYNYLAVFGGFALQDDNRIALQYSGLDHRVASDL